MTDLNTTPDLETMTEEEREQFFQARIEQREKEQAERNKQNRAKLLKDLRALGVTSVSCAYNGYGDDGEVETPKITPKSKKVKNKSSLDEFIFAFVYQQFPGFEINEGGQGEFFWNIVTDTIKIDHGQNITEIEETTLTDL